MNNEETLMFFSHVYLRFTIENGITTVGLNHPGFILYSWGWGLVSPEISGDERRGREFIKKGIEIEE